MLWPPISYYKLQCNNNDDDDDDDNDGDDDEDDDDDDDALRASKGLFLFSF